MSRFGKAMGPVWSMLTRTHPSAGEYLSALDGLRGVALLLVLASHLGNAGLHLVPGLEFSGAGKTGVWLFFALSSFLLTQQLLDLDAGGQLDADAWRRYAARRVLRIFPLYAVYLLICWMEPVRPYPRLDGAAGLLRHLLTIEGTGHLWSIAVEVHFYLLLPVLIVLWRYLLRRYVVAAVAAILVAIATHYILDPPFDRDGLVTYLPVFLAGSGAAVLHCSLKEHAWCRSWQAQQALAVLACGLITLLIVLTPGILNLLAESDLPANYWHRSFTLFGFLSALLVLASANAAPWFQAIFGALPLRLVGVVSFGGYVWHALLLANLRHLGWFAGSWAAWAFVAATLLIAIASYVFLESRFLRIGGRRVASRRIVDGRGAPEPHRVP